MPIADTAMPDVAIIGGGVVGVACALELARRGASVTVLERDRVGHGCSRGNAGWLTPSLAKPLAAPGHPSSDITLTINASINDRVTLRMQPPSE